MIAAWTTPKKSDVCETKHPRGPSVGTTSATQGVDGKPGEHFLLADSAEDQASAVVSLLRDTERAKELGQSARRFVEETYDWDACLAPIDGLVESCAASRK